MFLLYRDIFFKGIFSSFECNLLYFFFIFKNHNVNNDLLVYIFRVNTKILTKLDPCGDRLDNWLAHYKKFDSDICKFLDN